MLNRSLTAHVAIDRVLALAGHVDLPRCATGAALFADLAGFTPLTAALAEQLGPRRGAEELTRLLDVVYDSVIGVIDDYGGAVVNFSGDAVMCWFDDDRPTGAATGAWRAVTCATALHEAVHRLAPVGLPDGTEVSFALKVAIVAGTVVRSTAGDPAIHVVDVLAGGPLNRVGIIEQNARHGDVLLDAAAARSVAAYARLTLRPECDGIVMLALDELTASAPTAPWGDLPAVDDDVLQPWIRHLSVTGSGVARTELRPCVALFARFTPVDFDGNPRAPEALDAFMRDLQVVAVHNGGTLLEVTIGDKGSYVYITFGAPVAHEDQVDRALACAIELRDSTAGSTRELAIGVDFGLARTGVYGGRRRRTYGVLGDATNTAARLMMLAQPGEILASARLRRACRRRIRVDELGPVALKGQRQPIEIVRVIGAAHEAITFGALVGRSDELQRVTTALGCVAGGSGASVLVEGEPGIGKSHLVATARRLIEAEHRVSWREVAGDETDRSSFQAFVPLLRDLFFQDLAPHPETKRQLFDLELAELGDDLRSDASYLASVIGLRWADSPYERHEPLARTSRVVASIDSLLRADSKRRALILHVRDAHWLDDDSRAVVQRLAQIAAEHPLAVIVDARADDERGSGTILSSPTEHIRLAELDAGGVSTLLTGLLGGTVDPGTVDRLHERTRGNPLFVEQITLDLRERGVLGRSPAGIWSLADNGTYDLPLTLSAALVSRLDRLPSVVRETVLAAAVLGDEFDPAVLRAMLSGFVDGVIGALEAAEAAGVCRHREDGTVTFRHNLLRSAAYEMQLEADLRRAHRRAADVLRRTGEQTAASDAEIAHHEERAGRRLRAVARLRRAAQRAEAQFADRDACRYLERALELVEKPPFVSLSPLALTALQERLADAAFAVGDYSTSVAAFRAVLLAGDTLSPARRVSVWTRLGEALERWGQDGDAEAAFEEAIRALQLSQELDTASRIYSGLAMVHGRRGELDDAADLAEVALSFSGADELRAARARQCLCVIELRRGHVDRALDHGRRGLELSARRQSGHGLAAAHNNLGLVYDAMGDRRRALVEFRTAVEEFDAIGHEHGLACALDNLANVLAATGERDEAMACNERAVEILSRIGMNSEGMVHAMWQAGGW